MLNDESFDIRKAKIEELKRLFPEVVTEGGIDFEALKATLDGDIDAAKEKYRFTWNGKSELFSLINRKTKGALKPDTKKSGGEKAFESAENIIIEADNLEAMKLLMSAYHRKVKMIYIDPPYNKQKDFVYPDNWSDPLESYLMQTGQKDEFGLTASYQDKTGRLHTNWLNMIYPRLYLARNLLRDDGVIFVSIDDDEVHNLRKVMDEIFGEENFVGQFTRVTKKAGKSSNELAINHDYVLAYNKNNSAELNAFIHDDEGFKYSDEFVEERGLYKLNQTLDYGSIQYSISLDYEIEFDGFVFRPGNVSKDEMIERQRRNPKSDFCWRWSKELFYFGLKNGFVFIKGSRIYTKTYQNAVISKNGNSYGVEIKKRTKSVSTLDFVENKFSNDNSKKDLSKLFDENVFDYSKPVELIKVFTYLGTDIDKQDIVLDFFAGSGTTAHAVMAQNIEDGGNRKYILVQIPEYTPENSEARKAGYETIADITAERVRRVAKKLNYKNGFRYFRLDRSHFRVFEQMIHEKGKSKEEVLKLLRMSMFHDNTLMANWTPIGVAFEIGLKNGMPLTSKYKVEKNGGYTLHTLMDDERIFVFCFDADVKEDIAKLLPQNAKFVCLDKSLTDSVKLNIVAQIGLENVETI